MRLLALLLLLTGLARATYYTEGGANGVRMLTSFQTNSALFLGSGGASASSTTIKWTGAQSNRLAVTASLQLFSQPLPSHYNVCPDSTIRVTFYMANKANTTNNGAFEIYLANDRNNYVKYDFGFAARDTNLTYYGMWARYNIPKKKFVTTGTFNCATVDTILVGLKGQTATVDTVILGAIESFKTRLPKATIVLNVDDLWSSFYTQGGGKKMDSLRYHYTVFCNAGHLGAANKMSASQLDSLYAMGRIDVCNHGWTHDTIWTLTADSLTSLIRVNYNYLHGRYRGDRIWATPFGQSSRMADSVLRFCGLIDFARTTQGNVLGESPPYGNPYALRLIASLGNTITEPQLETIVNDMILSRTSGIILAHKLAATAEDINTWDIASWLTFWNYVKVKVDAGQLQVQSMTEYFNASNSRGNGGIGF